jgi:hypothetical protein
VPFRQRDQGIDRPPAEQAKITGILRDLHVTEKIEHPVKPPRSQFLRPGLPAPVDTFAVNHVITVAPLSKEGMHQLRRVLQVRVDDNDRLAPGVIQARGNGDFLAKVSTQLDHRNGRVLCANGAEQLCGTVGAAVIDVNDLVGTAGLRHHLSHPGVEAAQDSGLVVYRYDN